MATSSITKSFVIEGKEQVERFVEALEESARNRPEPITVAASQIRGEEALRQFMKEWDEANED